jgi:hypothetical protein
MTHFSCDQTEYMLELASMPAMQKCWCGWFALGKCPTCPDGKTLADRMAEEAQNNAKPVAVKIDRCEG